MKVRCKVAAASGQEADTAAQQFAALIGGWIDGSVGNSPFDYHVDVPTAVARASDFPWEYALLTPEEINDLYLRL